MKNESRLCSDACRVAARGERPRTHDAFNSMSPSSPSPEVPAPPSPRATASGVAAEEFTGRDAQAQQEGRTVARASSGAGPAPEAGGGADDETANGAGPSDARDQEEAELNAS